MPLISVSNAHGDFSWSLTHPGFSPARSQTLTMMTAVNPHRRQARALVDLRRESSVRSDCHIVRKPTLSSLQVMRQRLRKTRVACSSASNEDSKHWSNRSCRSCRGTREYPIKGTTRQGEFIDLFLIRKVSLILHNAPHLNSLKQRKIVYRDTNAGHLNALSKSSKPSRRGSLPSGLTFSS